MHGFTDPTSGTASTDGGSPGPGRPASLAPHRARPLASVDPPRGPIRQAVLLATHVSIIGGRRSDLALVRVGGVSLLKRALMTLSRGGVRRFVVVTAGPEVRNASSGDSQIAALEVAWVENAERPGDHGRSLRLARGRLPGDSVVVSCDRVFSQRFVERTLAGPPGAALAVAGGGGFPGADADAWSQRVRTDAERRAAEKLLLRSLRKPVDGLVARHINRRFSLAATRVLMHLPVRPNHVTAFSLLVGIAAAVVAGTATAAAPGGLVAGAVLWQIASMLDGIDGELARLKFAESRLGEWFDTLTDDVGKFAFLVGSGVGVGAVTGRPLWPIACVAAVLIQIALSIGVYRKLARAGSGSHFALAWDAKPRRTRLSRLCARVEFMARRDYYVFLWMCLAAVGLTTVGIAIMCVTTLCVLVHEVLRPRRVRLAPAARSR